MPKLSVNINKIALLRNSRGSNIPNVLEFAKDCERFGAQGITVHPRQNERHITRKDVYDLKKVVTTEFNIEGNPVPKFIELVKSVKPQQVTLVPDADDALTSDHGWDTIKHKEFLLNIITELKSFGCRVSIFTDPIEQFLDGAKEVGADRIELYTGPFAHQYTTNKQKAVEPFINAAAYANKIGLGVNAGHDLNLTNLKFFHEQVMPLHEVSIGHALISDSIYFGLENTIGLYKNCLR